MIMDNLKLMDDSISILERLEIFLKETEKLGYSLEAIKEGTLNEHLISNAFEIPPSLVCMYFNLYLCEDEEKKYLAEMNYYTSLVNFLMHIEPAIRNIVYKNIDKYLDEEYPIEGIINFIDNGNWRIRIRDVFDNVNKEYWAAISSYLKDTNLTNGTIIPSFRNMLMKFKIYKKASDGQLDWLERAIIHDYEEKLNIFVNESLRKKYPKDIEWIEKYLIDYIKYELYINDVEFGK